MNVSHSKAEKKIENLFLIAEPRDDFSFSGVVGSFSFGFAITFQREVLPTSSEKLISPRDASV